MFNEAAFTTVERIRQIQEKAKTPVCDQQKIDDVIAAICNTIMTYVKDPQHCVTNEYMVKVKNVNGAFILQEQDGYNNIPHATGLSTYEIGIIGNRLCRSPHNFNIRSLIGKDGGYMTLRW